MTDFGAPGAEELSWFRRNNENLLALVHRFSGTQPEEAGRAALCLTHLMIRRGPFDASLEMLEGVLAALGERGNPQLRCQLLLGRGIARSGVGQLARGGEDLEAASLRATEAGLPNLRARAQLYLGLNSLRHGKLAEARERLEAARDDAVADGDDRVRCRALDSMGMCLEAEASFEQAEGCYEEALTLARSANDNWEEVRVRSKMGSLCSFMPGREDEARGHFEWAWSRSREVGDRFIEASTAYNLGRLNLNLGYLADADRFLERGLESFREMGNQGSVGFVRTARGLLELERGNPAAAQQELNEASRLLAEADHQLALSYALATQVLADLMEGDISSAEARVEKALEPVVKLKHGVLQGIVQCIRTVVAAKGGLESQLAAARDAAQQLLSDSAWGEGQAMLRVVRSIADDGSPAPDAPDDLGEQPLARARVAWRIISSADGAESSLQPFQTTSSTRAPRRAANDELRVEMMGRWFQLGQGDAVDLSRKRTLKPLLLALVELHASSPGEALNVDGVFEAVWPGERIFPEAKKNRVYVAIATLRKTGLDDALETRGDGYLLRPKLKISWAEGQRPTE